MSLKEKIMAMAIAKLTEANSVWTAKPVSVDVESDDSMSVSFELDRTPSCEEIKQSICDFVVYLENIRYVGRDGEIDYDVSHQLIWPDADCSDAIPSFDSMERFGKKIEGATPSFLSEESKRAVKKFITNDDHLWNEIRVLLGELKRTGSIHNPYKPTDKDDD